MALQSALDRDVLVLVERFLEKDVPATVPQLYTALQRSNSSLKRKQKKVLEASLERVLKFLDLENPDDDSEAAVEQTQSTLEFADVMNRSLRANLAPLPAPGDSSRAEQNGAVKSGESGTRRYVNGESAAKRRKTERQSLETKPDISLKDVAGMDGVIEELADVLLLPLLKPDVYTKFDLNSPRGVLLHGPPGCGKTMLCRAYAAALGVPFIEILGPSVVSGMSGESEKAIRDVFEEARSKGPSIIFIDEIDAIAPKRETSQSQMEKRMVAQLLVSMDELQRDHSKPVIVLAATNRPDSLDPALRRGGRFSREINITVPDESMRKRILETQTRKIPLSSDVDFGRLAKLTAGFVGADLHDLVVAAGTSHLKKYRAALLEQQLRSLPVDMDIDSSNVAQESPIVSQQEACITRLKRNDLPEPAGFESMQITMDNFLAVLPTITPSSKREGFATKPDISWSDIGALNSVRQQLEDAIVDPIQNPKTYKALGATVPTGVLLWGPPGCGKTLIAKAVAAESGANFISIKGPELLNKFVGESEAAVRKVFARARSSVPCVIFFDELDALVPKRDNAGSEASSRVVNTLLTELDGVSVRAGIYVIAATNRPDMIDDAMLRPGRIDVLSYVDLPDPEGRVDILKALVRAKPCNFTPEIAEIARQCRNFSGADLGSLVTHAVRHAVKRLKLREEAPSLELEDFAAAGREVSSSVRDIEKYHRLRKTFGMR